MNEPKRQPRPCHVRYLKTPNAKPACELDCLDTPVSLYVAYCNALGRKLFAKSGTNYLMNSISW